MKFSEEKFIKNKKDETKNQPNTQSNKYEKIYLDENDDEINLAKSGNTSIQNADLLNLSNDCKSIDFEKNNISPVLENRSNKSEMEKEEKKQSKFNPEFKGSEEEQPNETEKRLKLLEEENLSLRKNMEILLQELNKSKLELSKVSYEKFSLFSELNEILESLSKVDLDEMNKFYFNYLNHNLTKSSIFSAMGIKYNILSASNTLGIHALTDSYSFNLGNNDNLKKKANIDSAEKNDYSGKLFSEKYLQNVREKYHKYDNELNNYVYYMPERLNRKGNNSFNNHINNKNVHSNSNKIRTVFFDSETWTDI